MKAEGVPPSLLASAGPDQSIFWHYAVQCYFVTAEALASQTVCKTGQRSCKNASGGRSERPIAA